MPTLSGKKQLLLAFSISFLHRPLILELLVNHQQQYSIQYQFTSHDIDVATSTLYLTKIILYRIKVDECCRLLLIVSIYLLSIFICSELESRLCF